MLSLLWLRFDPWPGNSCMPTNVAKKKKKKKKKVNTVTPSNQENEF